MKKSSKVPSSLAERLANLPKNILTNHDHHDLASLVLHYLAHKDCFGFKKAAYFVDNPDFDHFLGVAGYADHECLYGDAEEIWKDPKHYSAQQFHKNVLVQRGQSFKGDATHLKNAHDIVLLARSIGMENPKVLSLDVKHGNHGILLYESEHDLSEESKKLLHDAAHFLGFCSINHK